MPKAVVAFGSNIAPERNLPAARRLLAKQTRILKTSAVYRTPPVGNPAAPPFLNAAALIETDLPPAALRSLLKEIERALGRERGDDPNAPRTIDLDLVLYPGLPPHSDVYHYAHTAIPAAEVAPEWPMPDGRTLAEWADALKPATIAFERKEIPSWQ